MIKDYLKHYGCTDKLNINIIGSIPNNNPNQNQTTSEHWIVQGCKKAYNMKVDFANDGNQVVVTEHEL